MTHNFTPPSTCTANLAGLSLPQMCRASTCIVFLSLLDEMIRSNPKISRSCEQINSVKTPDEEYDFIVVGGGGAGAVVAGRLTEDPRWNVLVMEHGGEEPPGAQIPIFTENLEHTSVDWNYTSTNEKHACLATNGTCRLTCGKMLGGGTSHNAMTYIRGIRSDYDNWAAMGNVGWAWKDVLPFYLKSEDNGEIEKVGRRYHATGGPLSVQKLPYIPPFAYSILEAAAEIGYGVSEDLNGERITGFSLAQGTSKNGVRVSSATAFLRPVRNRKNLHVTLNSRATKVIIEGGRAVGVEYYQNGKLKTVYASREVIISAGAIESPHILLLSGIGPKEHLEAMGVKVVKDLPGVGENFQDHIAFTVNYTINEPAKFDVDWKVASQYLFNQTGPMASVGLVSVVARLNTEVTCLENPNVQLHFAGYTSGCGTGKVGALENTGKRILGIHASNIMTQSIGKVALRSKDPLQYPMITANYMSQPGEIDILIKAIEMGLAMTNTKAMKAHNFTLSPTPIPACSHHPFPSKKYWACAIRQGEISDYHLAGSCKMGPHSDPMAVVDPQLRVHGIKGLRVVDASIMPKLISGNTAAPSIMIAERGADFIKKYWA